ncbi:MAG: hypothetical protein MR649_05560 [Prevotella sp.]|nr:hypothetical protein [Prevotella sp.]
MKQFLRSFLTLLMLVVWASGFAQEKLTGSWDLTKKNSEWTATGNVEYFSQPYGYKKVNGTLVNKSIADFSTSGITQIKVGFKCLQNGGTTSRITIYLVDANGQTLGTEKVVTPVNATADSKTAYKYATFTSNLEEATGFMMKVTTLEKNILVNGAEYEVTYTSGPSKTATTLTFPQPAINIEEGNEASFTGQTATLTAGETVLDKTITYTKSGDDIFATFNTTTGAATLKTGVYGTATVTATYAGDDTYAKAERSYTVTIKNPNVIKTTYDFVKSSYNYPRTGTLKNGAIISNKSPVTIVNTKNGTKTSSKFTNDDLRNYKDAVLTINAKEGCLISKITIKGTRINQLNLNGENGIWNDGVWTGSAESVSFTNPGGDNNSVCFETITIEYTAPAPITLSEAADDTDTKIKNNNGKTLDVTLARTLTANAWNTICLPFDVTAEQIEDVLKSKGNVKEFDREDANTPTIYFKDATTMTAGKPYLIKPTVAATELVFKGVTIKNVDALDRMVGDKYNMCGVFGKYEMKTNGSELFLTTQGKFAVPAPTTNVMRGFRAYFLVPTNTAGAALNLSFGEATGIDGVAADAVKNVKVYNVNGQYVGTSLDALPKGLYIVGGKKVLK